ncbi:mechanosensitive ion channel family protein, partial [Patescibacteria group bacterium]|nr:mechanosensitive ion channel family protein [Patescibacteria group bacterium]MBU1703561.1 mechanosensitive ion channel family protein [Patescibacteria group bacterium]MBU1954291.1 mechanosensitive ion channel family protein [Patescibacteria group bacterium]
MNILNSLLAIPTALAQNINAGEIASQTEGQLTQLVTYIIGKVPLWITAFIVVVLTFIVARMVKAGVENKMATEGIEEEHKEVAILAARTANAGVLIIGITVALKIAGIDLTTIIAAGAFGVGFALQDIIMNFIAGIMILSSRHYTIGDIIKVDGKIGKIVEIQTRATILKAFDGTKIVVPNSILFKNQVTSLTSNPFRRIELINGVNYGEDLKRSAEIVLNAVKATRKVLAEPKPSIVFYEWGDYSINFKVRFWVESRSGWLKTRHQVLLNIDKAMDDAGINIPYPIQTIEVTDAEKEEQKLLEEFERREKEEKAKPKAPAVVESAPAPAESAPAP